MKDNAFLGTEPVGKLLLRLSIPTIAAQLINMLYNVVDRIFIGHIRDVGDLALTGVGVCMPLIMIVSAFSSLCCSGGAPRASIFMGQGDDKAAENTMGSCFSLQIVMSLLLTAALLLWHEDLLWAFGASKNTITYAADYMRIYAFGTLFVQLTLGMNYYITAQGFSKVAMKTVLIGAVCNIALDPLFIYGFGLGVKGAALATIISQGVSCIWAVTFLAGKNSRLRLRPSSLPIRPKLVLPCLALGLSPFVMQSSEGVISVCFNASLLEYGGDIAVGAMTILASVMQFAMLPLQGMAQGAGPITSYNYGARKKERVKESFSLLLKCSLIYSLTLWAFIMVCPRLFASIFTPDPALITFTAGALRVYCGVLGIFGLQIACQMTFLALGNAKSSITVAVVRKFVLLLPLIYLMPRLMANQTMAVYAAEPIADILAVSFTAFLFSRQFKKTMAELDTPLTKEGTAP